MMVYMMDMQHEYFMLCFSSWDPESKVRSIFAGYPCLAISLPKTQHDWLVTCCDFDFSVAYLGSNANCPQCNKV